MAAVRRTKMHADEIETDVSVMRRLLKGQFPQWAGLPIELIESYGTDHDIYRLGAQLAARMPRIGSPVTCSLRGTFSPAIVVIGTRPS